VANTAAAIVVLLAIVLMFNLGSILLRNRYEKKRHR
jgi:ABC-type phosphate transport system permease subunit